MIYGVLEIEIMNVIWDLQVRDEDANISVADVVELLNDINIERAYTTVKTVMDRLVSKDILVRYKNGKKYFYRSAVDKIEAAKKAVEDVSKQFFNGSHIQMLRFVEQECEKLLVQVYIPFLKTYAAHVMLNLFQHLIGVVHWIDPEMNSG